VPSDAKGDGYVIQVTFDTGPLAGEITGRSKVKVKTK
jgi:hypothetical protein